MGNIFNIFMAGVGGQGIGMLSEILVRACHSAGWKVHACDTHGLAQRGGMVTSHLRLGDAYSPLVPEGEADLVLALERTEALRAAVNMLRDGGSLAWYDADWEALDVRLHKNPVVKAADVEQAAVARGARAVKVFLLELPDPRMQNIALIGQALKAGLIPRLEKKHVLEVMKELMSGSVLEKNMEVLESEV